MIQKYFKTGGSIDFKDYIAARASIGKLMIRELLTDAFLSEIDGIYQYVIAWEIDFVREHSRP